MSNYLLKKKFSVASIAFGTALALYLQAFVSCNLGSQMEDPLINSLDSIAQVLHTTGLQLDTSGNMEKAIPFYDSSLHIRTSLKPHLNKTSKAIAEKVLEGIVRTQQNLGNCFHALKAIDKAETEILLCINTQKSIQKDWNFFWPKRMGKAYQVLGQIYNQKNELEKARFSALLAAGYYQQAGKAFLEEYRNALIDLSHIFSTLLIADSMRFYSQKAIEVTRQYNLIRDSNLAKAWNNYGAACELQNLTADALGAYDSVLVIYGGDDKSNFNEISKCYHNIGSAYYKIQDFGKALNYIDMAINRNSLQKTSLEGGYRLAGNYTAKGDILQAIGRNEGSIAAYDQAIMLYANSKTSLTPLDLIKKINIAVISNNHKIDLLGAIRSKAQSLINSLKKEEALAYYDAAIILTNKYRVLFSDQSSKFKLAELTKKIFEGAIEACLALSKKEEAFAYAEQSKSFALLESVLQLKAMKRLPTIDPQMQEAWNDARTEINRLNQKVNDPGNSMAKEMEFRQQISAQQLKLDSIEQIFQKNEAYVKLTTALNPPAISFIQSNLLEDNQALAEFFIGENQSYLFYIPKNGELEIFPLHMKREILAQKTDSMLFAIRLPHENRSAIKDPGILSFFEAPDMEKRCDTLYANYARELYNDLLVGALSKNIPQRLMVIPDDVLGYLPFDALLTDNPAQIGEYGNYPYLWKSSCNISYCYSGALLKEMRDNETRSSGRKMLAFALSERGFKSQFKALATIFGAPGGRLFSDFKTVRTKSGLKNKVKNAAFLHFSTHGRVDDWNPNNSYLDMREGGENSTENNRLHLYDIYGLKAENTAMVVTSACETGFGRLYRGEGIISLARGFSAAGASSIITTLWSVYQVESEEIFTAFYQNLKDGKSTKDEALAKAKASFFEGKDHAQVAPYYWAGIVPVGEMEPVALPQKSSGISVFLIIGVFIGLIFIALLLKRKQR